MSPTLLIKLYLLNTCTDDTILWDKNYPEGIYTNKVTPGVNIIKKFGVNLITIFCKLDHFIAMQHILIMFIKWFSLTNVSVNLFPKSFMRLTPGGLN